MENYRYLIRIPNHLGDTIMALPVVKAFLQSSKDETIALLIPEWAESIYEGIGNVESTGNVKNILLPSIRLHGLAAIIYQTKLFRKYKIQNGILLTPSFSSALAMFLGGVKGRFGQTEDGRGPLLNNCLTFPRDEIIHRAEKYKLLLEKAGEKKLEISSPNITISDCRKIDTVELLNKYGIGKTDKYLVMAAQAVAESRRWGTDNYSALSSKLIENYDIKIILMGTADQYNAGQKIALDEKKISNLCGQTDIGQAVSVLAGASMFIGNDSGLAHLASAVDIPLLILSGADNPKETSPVSDKKVVIIKSDLDCISCVKNICPKSGENYMKCMKDITVNEVFDSIPEKILL